MPTRDELYEYLREKSERDRRVAEASKMRDMGSFAGALSNAAASAGSLGGKYTPTDTVSKVSEDLYKTEMQDIAAGDEASNQKMKLQAMLQDKMRSREDSDLNRQLKMAQIDRLKNPAPQKGAAGQIVPGFEKEGSVLVRLPDGSMVEQKLPSGFQPKKTKSTTITESERKAGLQAKVASQELMRLEDIEKAYTPGARDLVTSRIPDALGGNYFKSKEQQQYIAANKALADVMLRTKSGANFTKDEMVAQIEAYSIQPGDDPSAIEDKKRRRKEFINAMIESGGRGTEGMETVADEEDSLTPEEQAELDQLESEFGGGQ